MSLRRRISRRLGLNSKKRHLLFAFTGGSGARPGMGAETYRSVELFRRTIDEASGVVEDVLGWNPAPFFRGEYEEPKSPEIARRNNVILLGLVQMAQVDRWRSEGVMPGGVLAVSLGEMIAPYASGALSREDSARVLAVIMQGISRTRTAERMFQIDADADTARRLCRSAPFALEYLGATMPGRAVVICREEDATAARSWLGSELIRSDHGTEWAYHTRRLDLDRRDVEEKLRGIRSLPAQCPIYSAAAGGLLPGDFSFDAGFFSWMVSGPFHFAEASVAALQGGFDTIINIGADPSNRGALAETARECGHEVLLIDSMRAEKELEVWKTATEQVRPLRFRKPLRQTIDDVDIFQSRQDRFELYEEIRKRGPVQYLPRNRVWIAVDYESVSSALSRPEIFSSAVDVMVETDALLLASDPPEHTVIRRILAGVLTADGMRRRSDLARATVEYRIENAVAKGEMEVVTELAEPLVRAVSADLVGLDAGSIEPLFVPVRRGAIRTAQMERSTDELMDKSAAGSQLYSALLREGKGLIDERAAIRLVQFVWSASMTTRRAIPSAILLLLANGDVRRAIERDRGRLPSFIEEALRLEPPEHIVPRIAMEGAELGKKELPAGSVVHLCLAAANRDPARFDAPTEIRLDGRRSPHLTFGGGAHRCVGAALAREQMIVALGSLFRIVPDFAVLQPLGTVRYVGRAPLRHIESMVIAL